MMQAYISADNCQAHERCPARKKCPTKALVQLDPGEVAAINTSLCRGCGDCVAACPERAIGLRQV